MSFEKAYCLPPNLPDLQDGWEWKPLGELIASERGICYGIVQPGKHDENGVPMINSGDIFDTSPSINIQFKVSKILHSKFKRSTLKGGEILLTLVGANFGRVAIAPQSYAGYNCSRAIGVIPVVSDAEYIMYALQTPLARYFMDNWANTTAQPTFNLGDVTNLPIPWAPKNEREKIHLALTSLDRKIELNRQTNKTLEQIAQALFKSWFVDFEPTRAKIAAKEAGASPEEIERAAMCAISGKTPDQLAQLPPETQQNLKTTAALFPDALVDSELGEIPEGWTLPFFDDLVVAKQGRYLSKDEMHILPSRDFQIPVWGGNGVLGYTTKKSYNEPIVLLTCRGSNCGLVRYTESEAWVSNNAFACLPNFGSTFFLLTYFRFESFDDCVSGSAQPQITYSALKTKKMKYPIESKLCNEFSRILDNSFLQILANSAEMKELADTRDLVLPRLLSGELIAL